MDFPTKQREEEIIRLKVPGVDERLAKQVVFTVQTLRDLDLKKVPSISETLDWARALVILNIKNLDPDTVTTTLNFILKYQSDIEAARKNMAKIVEGIAALN
jgi:MoxR-like ATPase